jgi:hypothetical protein
VTNKMVINSKLHISRMKLLFKWVLLVLFLVDLEMGDALTIYVYGRELRRLVIWLLTFHFNSYKVTAILNLRHNCFIASLPKNAKPSKANQQCRIRKISPRIHGSSTQQTWWCHQASSSRQHHSKLNRSTTWCRLGCGRKFLQKHILVTMLLNCGGLAKILNGLRTTIREVRS